MKPTDTAALSARLDDYLEGYRLSSFTTLRQAREEWLRAGFGATSVDELTPRELARLGALLPQGEDDIEEVRRTR